MRKPPSAKSIKKNLIDFLFICFITFPWKKLINRIFHPSSNPINRNATVKRFKILGFFLGEFHYYYDNNDVGIIVRVENDDRKLL
jgi:hypothetical protein